MLPGSDQGVQGVLLLGAAVEAAQPGVAVVVVIVPGAEELLPGVRQLEARGQAGGQPLGRQRRLERGRGGALGVRLRGDQGVQVTRDPRGGGACRAGSEMNHHYPESLMMVM